MRGVKAGVIVIGLGPAGIIAARTLAGAGVPVTAIQAESRPSSRASLVSPPPTVRSGPHQDAVPSPAPQAGRDGMGGSKLLAAPQAYRLDPWTLRTRTATEQRYGVAGIPDDADVVDWPIGTDDLAPYYDRVEALTDVAVRPPTAWTRRMSAAAEALNWPHFAAPAAADVDASPLLNGLPVTVIRATVTAILQTSTGTVAGVEYVDGDGMTKTLAAEAVIVAGSVIPTTRLLLLSGISGRDTVGKWFMSHNSFVVHGDFPGIDLERRTAGAASAVAVSAFESDEFDHSGLGFLGGSILQAAMTGPWSDERHAQVAVGLDPAPDGTHPRDWVRRHETTIGTVWAQPDQLPRPANRIDLDPTHRDSLGRPVARVTFSLAPDDLQRWEFLAHGMSEWLEAAGARQTWRPPLQPQPLGTHLYGGARMGDDPETSVVDSFGRFHDVPGLIVAGSSTFPATGGRGPVATIEALAWRSADQLAHDLN